MIAPKPADTTRARQEHALVAAFGKMVLRVRLTDRKKKLAPAKGGGSAGAKVKVNGRTFMWVVRPRDALYAVLTSEVCGVCY